MGVIQGDLRSSIDRIWDAFWSGGISNPLEVIEQITYLMFLQRLDQAHTRAEKKARMNQEPIENPVFDADPKIQRLRWSRFKQSETADMYETVADQVFPWLRTLGGEGSTYERHMKDARFTIPTPSLLARVVEMLDELPVEDGDTKGDLYEYMLSKIATAGQNGQFRTPRHIIELMVEMTQPKPGDEICDPACGSAGFLVASAAYLAREHHLTLLGKEQADHFHNSMFHGFDFDRTMLRIGSMNMLLHNVQNPDIRYRDSLSQSVENEHSRYTLILANPPFAGSLDLESSSKKLQAIVKTRKTELLFMALFLRLLKPGGRAAVIVPDGVLFNSSNAYKALRKKLVDEHKLEAVVKLPPGVFKPYAGVSTAILFFTRTDSGGTDNVWFYDVQADGQSLDDKRTMLLDEAKFGAVPHEPLSDEDHSKNNLPDVLARWHERRISELDRARSEQSFCVSREEIEATGYDLSINRYRESVYEESERRPPLEIIEELEQIEAEIQQDISDLKGMLG